RRSRAGRVQSVARTWGEIWHLDGTARLVRNEPLTTRRPDDFTHIDWLYSASRLSRNSPSGVMPTGSRALGSTGGGRAVEEGAAGTGVVPGAGFSAVVAQDP